VLQARRLGIQKKEVKKPLDVPTFYQAAEMFSANISA
jgi:hypothetical protein